MAVVAASWHPTVMDGLLSGARRALEECGVDNVSVNRVPGTIELTVACARLAPTHDALVALGVVIRGGTPHFDYVGSSVSSGLTQVSATSGCPIGFGVLTSDTERQALDRAGLPGSTQDKGHEAATAAAAALAPLAPRPLDA
jgi:6,7-dimethyl-8-ribityllumazine synthase